MKSASVAMKAHLASNSTTLAKLWKVTRQDGLVLGFTDHDQDIVYKDGGEPYPTVYFASTGFTPSAKDTKSDLTVDNMEVTGFLDSSSIAENDIRAGLYDYATIEIRIVNWKDLTMGDVRLATGTLGAVKWKNGAFSAEIRGLSQQLTTIVGELYGPLCRAEWGSTPTNGRDPGTHYFCNIDPTLWQQNGSVNTATDARTFVPTTGLKMVGSSTPTVAAPTGWFNDGTITFTSGANAGFTYEIRTWDGTTLSLLLPMLFEPAHADTFEIEPGCDKTVTTCQQKFVNIANFRGEPSMPGEDKILNYPNASGTVTV